MNSLNTPKCPLCGGTPEYILEEGDGICEYAGCPKCGLYVAPSWGDWNCSPNEEATWQRWRDLVSKFPPVARLKIGDAVSYQPNYRRYECTGKITKIETVLTIERIDSHGDPVPDGEDGTFTDDVTVWPWEFKQEGGAER